MNTPKFTAAFRNLSLAARRLAPGQGDRARRNARLKTLGAIRSLKLAMDKEFPRPFANKPKPVKPPKPAKPVLPFAKAWDYRAAKVFAAIAAETYGFRLVPKIVPHNGASKKTYGVGVVYFHPEWNDQTKWMAVCWHFHLGSMNRGLSHAPGNVSMASVIDLWRRFWSEQLPTTDIQAAAEQLKIIEVAAKRSATARKAIAARKPTTRF